MLIGFFTRLAALPLAGTMLTAMWLTQIGPAIQALNTSRVAAARLYKVIDRSPDIDVSQRDGRKIQIKGFAILAV